MESKIFVDEKGNFIDESQIDYSIGTTYFNSHYPIKHHDAVMPVQEQGHLEIIREYPNGGKDAEWVIDVEGVEGHEAYDEYGQVYVYHLFTKSELLQRQIDILLGKLIETDYITAKIAEGSATREEYADTIAQRQAWRAEINELQEKLKE